MSSTTAITRPNKRKRQDHAVESSSVFDVYLRIKPTKQTSKLFRIHHHQQVEMTYSDARNNKVVDTHEFKQIFNTDALQSDVYHQTTEPTLMECINQGSRLLIMAYGATNTGKTHTIQGTRQEPGLSYHILETLFGLEHAELSVSVLEIYNEMLRDLITDRAIYPKGMDSDLEGLTHATLTDPTSAQTLLHQTLAKRSQAATHMNAASSRSHLCIFIRFIHQDRLSHIGIVDLAGSERIQDTMATGETRKQAAKINMSLMTLRKVMQAMEDNKTSPSYIPFRDSKLTRLLQPYFLGGHVSLIVHVDPLSLSDTIQSMNFSSQCSRIDRATLTHARNYKLPSTLLRKTHPFVLTLALTSKFQTLQMENSRLRLKVVRIHAEMQERIDQIKKYESLVSQQEEYIQGENERILKNTEDLQRKENEKLQWAADAHEQQMVLKSREFQTLESDRQALNQQVQTMSQLLAQYEQQKLEMFQKMAAAKEEKMNLLSRMHELELENSTHSSRVDSLEQDLERTREEMKEMRERANTKDVDDVQVQMYLNQVEKLEKKLKEANRMYEKRLEEKDQEITNLKVELAVVKAKADAVGETMASVAASASSVVTEPVQVYTIRKRRKVKKDDVVEKEPIPEREALDAADDSLNEEQVQQAKVTKKKKRAQKGSTDPMVSDAVLDVSQEPSGDGMEAPNEGSSNPNISPPDVATLPSSKPLVPTLFEVGEKTKSLLDSVRIPLTPKELKPASVEAGGEKKKRIIRRKPLMLPDEQKTRLTEASRAASPAKQMR